MNQEVTVLVISPNKDLFDSVSKAAMIIGDSVRVLKRTSVKEAIELFDRLDLVSGYIQVYLDSKSCKAGAQSFVHLLDHDYAGITRRSVVLVDDASNINSMMSLAIAECVGDILNYPVLSIEVETAIRKQFPKLRDSIHSKSIV